MTGEIFIFAGLFVIFIINVLAIIHAFSTSFQNIESKKMENSIKIGDVFVEKDFTNPQNVNPFDEPSEDLYVVIEDVRKNEAGTVYVKYSYLTKNMSSCEIKKMTPSETKYTKRLSYFLKYYEPVTDNK